MVNVTKQNFLEKSNALIQKLPTAAFVSLELDLTGISIPNSSRPNKFDQLSERYSHLKNIPERYSIIRLNVALFHENPAFRSYARRIAPRFRVRENCIGGGGERGDRNNPEEALGGGDRADVNDDGGAAGDLEADGHANAGGDHVYNNIPNRYDARQGFLRDAYNVRHNADDESLIQQIEADMPLDNIDGAHEDGAGSDNDSSVHGYFHHRPYHRPYDSGDSSHSSSSEQTSDDSEIDDEDGDDHDVLINHNNNGADNAHGNVNDDGAHEGGAHLENPFFPRHRRRQRRRLRDRAVHRDWPTDEPPEYLVSKYDFYLFPSSNTSSREVVMNPTTIKILNDRTQALAHQHNLNGDTDGDENGNAVDQETNVGIDFKEWMVNGIPYTTLNQSSSILHQFREDYNHKETNSQGAKVKEWEEPTDATDIAFIARSMASLREWIDSAAPSTPRQLNDNLSHQVEEEEMEIIKTVPYTKKKTLRTCLRGKIENEYPSLHWDDHEENNNKQVLVRLNDEEKKIRDARRKKNAWRRMHTEKIGFARVFKALSDACKGELGETGDLDDEYMRFLRTGGDADGHNDEGDDAITSKRVIPSDGEVETSKDKCDLTTRATNTRRRVPIVVHNGFLDFLFLLTHFHHHKLPSTYEEAKERIHDYFPVVYDTKVLATESNELSFYSSRFKHSSLSELYKRFVQGDDDNDFINFPRHGHIPTARILSDISDPMIHTQDTEDGAFKVGSVFQCLCRRIKMHGLEHLDLEETERTRYLCGQIVSAKRSRVGSLLFLDDRHPESKLSAPLYGLNKVFMPESIFTVDLEAMQDPLKPGYTMSSIFRVSHPNRTVSLNEINEIIKSIKDPENNGRQSQKVQYEIGLTTKWFIVAARSKIPRGFNMTDPFIAADISATLRRQAVLLLNALENHFPENQIVSLVNVMRDDKTAWASGFKRKKKHIGGVRFNCEHNVDEEKGIFSRLLSKIGITRRKRKVEGEEFNSRKRVRDNSDRTM